MFPHSVEHFYIKVKRFFKKLFFLGYYPPHRQSQYGHEDSTAHETEWTKWPNMEGLLVDIVSVKYHPTDCHNTKNLERFTTDSKISEEGDEEDNRIHRDRNRREWESEELCSGWEEDIGTRKSTIQITETRIRSRGFCEFWLEWVCLSCEIDRIRKSDQCENHDT